MAKGLAEHVGLDLRRGRGHAARATRSSRPARHDRHRQRARLLHRQMGRDQRPPRLRPGRPARVVPHALHRQRAPGPLAARARLARRLATPGRTRRRASTASCRRSASTTTTRRSRAASGSRLPWLADNYVSDWCRCMQLGMGQKGGWMLLPEPDDEVLVAFEFGDIRRPYVIGGLSNPKDSKKVPVPKVTMGKVAERGFTSRRRPLAGLDRGPDAAIRPTRSQAEDGDEDLRQGRQADHQPRHEAAGRARRSRSR